MKIKCYSDDVVVILPDDDDPLFELECTEPLTPTSSYFTYNGTKYMTIKCMPYTDKNGKEAWMATLRIVSELGIGANSKSFSKESKIYGERAEEIQKSRERLKEVGIDTDILEEMDVDHTKMTTDEVLEMAEQNEAIMSLPPTPTELENKIIELETQLAEKTAQLESVQIRDNSLLDKLVEKGLITQDEADDIRGV